VPCERTVARTAHLLDTCVSPLLRGPADPTLRLTTTGWWRTARSPHGPGLQQLVRSGDDVVVTCWGPGAEWLAEQAPRLLGAADDVSGFDPGPVRAVAEAHRRRPWLRLGRTDLVLEALAPASIEQVVTGKEAFRAQRLLLQRVGDRPGGPALDEAHPAWGMRLPLSAGQWLAVPSWEFLRAGVEARRTRAILSAARTSRSLERLASNAYTGDTDVALRSLPGVGPGRRRPYGSGRSATRTPGASATTTSASTSASSWSANSSTMTRSQSCSSRTGDTVSAWRSSSPACPTRSATVLGGRCRPTFPA